ncbi:MAG: CBS domain-containing protein [Thaumarchaeota archaeon]|nr:CBS domain-containing protein [Nitrososphaerota archaeon]
MPLFKRFAKDPYIAIRDLMSSPVVSVGSDSALIDAVKLMRDRQVGSLAVTDKSGRLNGILTERDIIYSAANGLFERRDVSVSSVMSKNLITVRPEENLSQVIDKMREFNLRHMVVTDTEGKAVGVVAMRDILDIAIKLLRLLTPVD